MSSHFKWYPASPSDVVPWNARYSFPTQANKTTIVTPRIPPKNGADFRPGNVIRVEFPAQGYVNPANTFLEFDLTMLLSNYPAPGVLQDDPEETWIRMQNNISSIFSRVRLMYGSTPLEDIIDYNQIVRNLTEWTATSGQTHDQTSISEGIGGIMLTDGYDAGLGMTVTACWRNVRQAAIQGIDCTAKQGSGAVPNMTVLTPSSQFPFGTSRRYQIQFALGLFTQEKLIPAKYMASQLAIELTLATPAECMFNGGIYKSTGVRKSLADSGATCSYSVSNVSLIPEILEFDASYDASILKGLSTGGIPIKFSSWHTFQYAASGSQLNLQIQERSRSVKSIFACLKRSPAALEFDSGATLFMPVSDHTLQNFQYRIGGRYYPASPVQTSIGYGSPVTNGGAEAFCELQKALNIVGDYRLSAGVNSARFGVPVAKGIISMPVPPAPQRWVRTAAPYAGEAELDYDLGHSGYSPNGTLLATASTYDDVMSRGGLGSQCFAMAVSLESSNGMEVSGLNAEEQSDISLLANYSTAIPSGYFVEVFTYYDAMLVIKENNTIELVL